MFQIIDIGFLLMPISRPGLFTFQINGCYFFSDDFVSRSIRLLKTNKAFDLDKISARLLKDSFT